MRVRFPGVVGVPAQIDRLKQIIEEIVPLAVEQERLEGWIMNEVEAGAALPGLYPPNADNKRRYEQDREPGA